MYIRKFCDAYSKILWCMCNNYDAMVFFESKDNFHWLEITKVSGDASTYRFMLYAIL